MLNFKDISIYYYSSQNIQSINLADPVRMFFDWRHACRSPCHLVRMHYENIYDGAKFQIIRLWKL